MIFLRTSRGISLLERLGSFRSTRVISWILLSVLPIISALGLYLLLSTFAAYLTNPQIREFAKTISPLSNLLIPGLNPYVPILYGWIAIAVGIAVHEVGHGVIAKAQGIPVKSIGLLFFTIIPIGAFVEIDEERLMELKLRDNGRILAAGPGSNVCTAVIALACVLLLVGSMSPIVNGIGILEVNNNFTADAAGVLPGDIILMVNDQPVTETDDFDDLLDNYGPGTHFTLTIARKETIWSLNLSIPEGVVIFGLFQNYPAQKAGMLPGDLILSIANRSTSTPKKLSTVLMAFKPGEIVRVVVSRNNTKSEYSITLEPGLTNASTPFLGIWLAPSSSRTLGLRGVGLAENLENYRELDLGSLIKYLIPPTFINTQELVPYSDMMHIFYQSSVGEIYHPLVNLAFWLWFVNINLAIFNALPIYPFDGGLAFRALLSSALMEKFGKKVTRIISIGVGIFIVLVLVTILILPYLG